MIRVLYITRARLSLRRAYARNILKTAAALNALPDVIVDLLSSLPEAQDSKIFLDIHNVAHDLPAKQVHYASFLYGALVRMRGAFDVLYFRDPKLAGLALFARLFLRKKVIFEIHGNKEWKSLIPIWFFAHKLSHGAVFITDRLRTWYNPRKKPWVVAHVNAPDLELFKQLRKPKNELRDELGLSRGHFIAMYVGSALWNKVEILVSMMRDLDNNIHLVLVGIKSDEVHRIFGENDSAHMRSRVTVIERVDPVDVPKYLMAADALLVPPGSIAYEGSIASKLYEYIASGVPIVSHTHGANRELLRDGENALVVATENPKDFASAVERIKNDPALSRLLASRALEDAKQYTWESRALIIERLLKNVLMRTN